MRRPAAMPCSRASSDRPSHDASAPGEVQRLDRVDRRRGSRGSSGPGTGSRRPSPGRRPAADRPRPPRATRRGTGPRGRAGSPRPACRASVAGRSRNGGPIEASDQSKTTRPRRVRATFQGWQSPCTTVSGTPSAPRRSQASTRRGTAASHSSRTAGRRRSPSPFLPRKPGTSAARPVSGRRGSPARIRASRFAGPRQLQRREGREPVAPAVGRPETDDVGAEVAHQEPVLVRIDAR